jgi:hypothetical protein
VFIFGKLALLVVGFSGDSFLFQLTDWVISLPSVPPNFKGDSAINRIDGRGWVFFPLAAVTAFCMFGS